MDKKYIEENEIGVKYLRNQLASEELEEFEVYLMENPSLLYDLASDEVLANNLSKLEVSLDGATNGEIDYVNKTLVCKKFGWFDLSWLNAGALACTFLAGAFAMGLYERLLPQPANSKVIHLSVMRGEQSEDLVSTVKLPKVSFSRFSKQRFIVIFGTASQAQESMRARVTNLASIKTIELGRVRADEFGDVILNLKVNRFPPARYRVELFKDNEVSPSFDQVFETKLE